MLDETVRAVVNEGWQERAQQICKIENFAVYTSFNLSVLEQLTSDEQRRLEQKLLLVENYAQHMAMNMAKGTIKYPSDEYSIDTWLVEEADDNVDGTNYRLLRLDAMREAGLI